ncbi:MAG: hypothetical protein GXO23_06620 [Crenarchaeota archaeon]|nr:hypothetical protein [Thermoproteota archaeon]
MDLRKIATRATIILLIVTAIYIITTAFATSLSYKWNIVNMMKDASRELYQIVSKKLEISNVRHCLLLTNLKYSEIDGFDLYPLSWYFIVRGFVVPYNMVPIHSPVYATPWIFVYNNDTKMSIFIEFSRDCISNIMDKLRSGTLTPSEAASQLVRNCIAKIDTFKFDVSSVISSGLKEPSKVWNILTSRLNEYAAFSIVTLVTVWSHNAPSLLLLASELHNHVCPGLLSGFLMYRYLMDNDMISSQDKVYIIASPVYCKDDVYVQLFDASPGKRRIIVKLLPWSEQDEISKILGGNVAGIVIAYNPKTDSGVAYILAFNWTRVHIFLKKYHTSFHGPSWWVSRMISDIYMLKYVNNPSYFVKVLRTIHFKGHVWRYPSLFYKLGRAGVDPYVALGVLSQHNVTSTSSTRGASSSSTLTLLYVELAIIIVLIIIIIVLAVTYRRRRH